MAASETEQAEHAWMRKVLTPAFSARRMETLRPRVQELADGLFDDLGRTAPPADFHEKVSFPLPALVICELLGVPYEDRDDFRAWSDDAGNVRDGERSRAALEQLRGYMSALIGRKRRTPAQDVLSDLAVASDEARGRELAGDVRELRERAEVLTQTMADALQSES